MYMPGHSSLELDRQLRTEQLVLTVHAAYRKACEDFDHFAALFSDKRVRARKYDCLLGILRVVDYDENGDNHRNLYADDDYADIYCHHHLDYNIISVSTIKIAVYSTDTDDDVIIKMMMMTENDVTTSFKLSLYSF